MLSDLAKSNPEILAVLIAVLGFLAAGLLSRLMDRWLIKLEGYLRRRVPERLEHVDLRVLRQVLRATAYYGTLIIFLLASLQALSISVVKEWLSLLLQYVPQFILGAFIILSGYLFGVVIRSLLAGLMGVNSDHLIPRFAQLLVVTAAVLDWPGADLDRHFFHLQCNGDIAGLLFWWPLPGFCIGQPPAGGKPFGQTSAGPLSNRRHYQGQWHTGENYRNSEHRGCIGSGRRAAYIAHCQLCQFRDTSGERGQGKR